MDYANELLAQVQRLEEQQLGYQKQLTDKGNQLRQALGIAEACRAELAELRRKLGLTQVRLLAPTASHTASC